MEGFKLLEITSTRNITMKGKWLRQTKDRNFEVEKLRKARISNYIWGREGSACP